MFCRNCGEPINENQAVCLGCGFAVGKGAGYCPRCGESVGQYATYCQSCGIKFSQYLSLKRVSDSSNLAGNDKLTVILLCAFLGFYGVHNFVMGETKKGVFKIFMSFCFGLSVIFVIYDLIKLANDSYEVNPDKLV